VVGGVSLGQGGGRRESLHGGECGVGQHKVKVLLEAGVGGVFRMREEGQV